MDEEQVIQEEQVVEPTEAPDEAILAEAFEQGWKPKDQWTGKPEEWTDAETFVRRGREINPILRKTLKKKDAEIDALRRELTEMKGTVQELAEHRTKIEKMAYDRALKDLKEQRKDAIREGDFERASDVDEAIDQLKDAKVEAAAEKKTPATPPAADPRVSEWIERNPWYNDKPENADLVDYANGLSNRLVQIELAAGRKPDPDVILPQVAEKVKKAFPGAFKTTPGMFDSGGGSSSSSGSGKGKGFPSLPSEAKAQFERFYKSGYYPNMKKEDAQAQYFSDYQ